MKKYLLTGLLIWVPVAVTFWVLSAVVGLMDQTLMILPEFMRPESTLGFRIPGLGVLLTFGVLLLTGVFAANIVGDTLLTWLNSMLLKVPFFNSIYSGVKQVSDTLLNTKGQAFRQAVLVRFHHESTWSIGFITGDAPEGVAAQFEGPVVSVYVPTALSPTAGYVVLVAEKDLKPAGMTVDEAIKYVVSMGVVSPPTEEENPIPF